MPRVLALAVLAVLLGAAPAGAQAVDVCHAAGSAFTAITVDGAGLAEHLAHEDDIVPAPESGCPASAGATPEPEVPYELPSGAQVTPAPEQTPIYGIPVPEEPGPGTGEFDPVTAQATPRATTPAGSEQGDAASPPIPPPVTGTFPQTATSTPGGPLANTGGEPLILALLGLGLVLSGFGLRARVPGA